LPALFEPKKKTESFKYILIVLII